MRNTFVSVLVTLVFATPLWAQPIAPPPSPSDLTVEVTLAGTMPITPGDNIASPQPYGRKELFLISHQPPRVFSLNTRTSGLRQIFDLSQAPKGIEPTGSFSLMNVAGNRARKKVYMVFTSITLPKGIPTLYLPDPDNDPSGGREDFVHIDEFNPTEGFNSGNNGSGPLLNRNIYDIDAPDYTLFSNPRPLQVVYQVFVEFTYKKGVLRKPRPFLALQTQVPFHNGGAMTVMRNGKIVYTTGDNLPLGMDGRRAPQDDHSHLSKLLIINPRKGKVKIAAKGLRNVQHLQRTKRPYGVAFTDIGGVTAEEVNFISWRDLRDTTRIENFGWGRNPDGLAREGTFYVGEGIPFKSGTEPAPEGVAPQPEPGFRQPLAQYGRDDLSPFNFVAISGPVQSRKSFHQITLAMGDLASGEVYATTDVISGENVELFRVNLVDTNGDAVGPNNSLNDLAGGRSDPRFFLFPNGEAGVLLEATGDYYVLREI